MATATDAPPATKTPWHCLEPADALARAGSSPEGLGSAEAAARLPIHGRNELVDGGTKHPLALVWEQLTAVMVVILIAAALLSLALGKLLEAGAIGAIVVLFTALGFLQEYRAEKAIAALRKLAVPTVRALREGVVTEVPAGDLVPGDLVLLEAGNVVPADLRIVEAASLRIQEAALTGESEPVDKRAGALDRADLALGDRLNMAFSGTQVTYGRATGVVVATGMSTEIGRIATLLQEVEAEQTPLQARLDHVGKQLAVLGVAVAAIVVVLGAIAGEPFADLVLTAISVTVAVVPEGLPAVVTFTLAIGAQRMLRRNALIRKLPAVETLGSVTVICSDKTGTLTQNRMTVTRVEVLDHRVEADALATDTTPAYLLTLAAGALCNDTEITDDALLGDPTETAIVAAARHAGIDVVGLRAALPRAAEQPFDSERKRMSTVHPAPDASTVALAPIAGARPVAFVKGAVDGLLTRTEAAWRGDAAVPMTTDLREEIAAANDRLASDGIRVLGVAYRTLDSVDDVTAAEEQLTFLGLIAIIDPPRPEVRDAVATCTTAGIRVVMITGDHPLTARAIATDLGITDTDLVLTGAQVEQMDDALLERAVGTTSVFARVSPEHKLRIVTALRDQGEIVSMTGDGVNDAPALKRAHIGVAMGITGTDVSKEASEMVLRDDNFATIVAAVEEGRVIYDNLRRFVKFAVAGNVGKILVMVGWPLPFLVAGADIDDAAALLPLQLLWLNLMTDGLLGLSLGVEPAEKGVMRRAPHRPDQSIWANGLGRQAVWSGVLIGLAALVTGYAYHEAGSAKWQTMIFMTVGIMQVFQAIGSRSTVDSLRTIGLTTNRLLVALGTVVIALQLAAVYTPLRDLLDLHSLGAADLALAFALGAAFLAVLEAEKAVRRRATL